MLAPDPRTLERTGARHSWNADFAISNWLLFNLQLQPDHLGHMDHAFTVLQSRAGAQQLPASDSALIPVELIPPAWFAAMDRLLTAIRLAKGECAKVGVVP